MAKSVVLKPREVIAGLSKLGFEILPKRGKGSHVFAVKLVVCKDGEPHTICVTVPRYKRELHPDTLASICTRTGADPRETEAGNPGNLQTRAI